MNTKLYKTEKENYVLVDPTKGTYDDGYMLGTSRESQYNKLSIKNCQSIERGYDLDELIDNISPKNGTTGNISERIGFVKGFQKALDLNNTKLYTLEDMMNCWNKALEFQTHKETLGEYIQSLQQTEWDVDIVEECLDKNCDGVNKKGECITTGIPKLDEEGCLILKKL